MGFCSIYLDENPHLDLSAELAEYIMAFMLSPLGWLYGKIINQRNEFYNKGTLKSHSLGVPTISVGNITVGGTGKTPLVAYIAKVLADKGEKVCIISRGYKRENEKERVLVSDGKEILADVKKAGDEPFELAKNLLGKAIVVSDANRVEAGHWANDKFGITVFLLDDAFQHLKVKRDLDIVTIDATNPFGNKKTLPAGILREPIQNLVRADLIIITRANLINNINNLKSEIKKYNQTAQIISSQNKFAQVSAFEGTNSNLVLKKDSTSYLAFCALGNPNNFFEQLRKENFKLAHTKSFTDHHFYTQKDIDKLENLVREKKADALITTVKDAVKLKGLSLKLPCHIAQNQLIFDKEKELHEILHAALKK